jgi:hypothetical protein
MERKYLIIICLLFQTLLGIAQISKPIGINISSVNDYSTELVFTDAFKQCREWISSNADGSGPWDTQIAVPLNSNGYPLEIPYNDGLNPAQILKTLMLWDIGSAQPLGMYRLKVSGTGQVRLNFGASGTYNCPVDTLVNVNGPLMLEIIQSDVTNPINDIKFILPDYINTYQSQKFTTEFLDFLNDFQVIRFMDFTNTNDSPVITWNDRTPDTYYTQAKLSGASWENVIALANQTQKDIWINIPHKADDNYITQLASLLQNGLNPEIKIYLEYSNELWNSSFSQHADCALFAQNLGYTGQPWERTWKYTAKRSADVFRIFEDVFTNDQRLIKIIPSQAANSWLSDQLVTYFNDPFYNPTQVTADAIAIAPYFGNDVADDIVINNQVNTITIPQIIQNLQTSMTNTSFPWIANNKIVADNHNLQLICYEGGQHLVATGSNINDTALTAKLIATNHDPLMQNLYCNYFDYWYDTVGTLFCHFSSHGKYSKYGSWGIKENFEDVNNPKYLALKNCVFPSNNLSNSEITMDKNSFMVFPNPANEFLTIKNHMQTDDKFEYHIVDFTGRILKKGDARFNEQIDIGNLTSGNYIIQIKTEKGKMFVKKLTKI